MLFADVTHLADGLSLATDVKGGNGKVSHLLSGYMENSSIHNRTTVNSVLENVIKK
jgi:hypothetical protein